MKGLACKLAAIAWLLVPAAALHAAETKEDKLAVDETQAQYTRKSITYLGMFQERGVDAPDDALAVIEKAIRAQIEIKRFDYNAVDASQFRSIDDFVGALQAYVKKRAYDRAAAEAEFDTRFKAARVYAADIDRIMRSAYLYHLELFVYRNKHFDCPWNPAKAKLLKCTPGTSGMRATVNARVNFYRTDLTAKPGVKPYSLLKTLKEMPGKGYDAYEPEPRPPDPPKLRADATDREKRQAERRYRQAQERYRKALAEYRLRLPELRHRASVKAAAKAASELAMWLNKSMKKIPDFQLKTPVTAALSDGVEFMLGAGEGVRMDDTYDVTEFDAAGKKTLVGYVKVREIGRAQGTGEGTASYAEKVREKREFVGGEALVEHPMVNINVGIHPVFEYLFAEFPFDGDKAMLFGAGMYIDYDLANIVGASELYVSIEGDFLYLGQVESLEGDPSLSLVHGMLGIKKKWYVESLVFAIGLRGGVSYYVIEGESQESLIGGGGDAFIGLEYYIKPEFSVYLNAAGRFFTNPLQLSGVDANYEMGVCASLGARLGF